MAFLFDTDALSEALKKRPAASYLMWLSRVPRLQLFTSAVVVGGLYKGAFRSSIPDWHIANIESRILPKVTVIPFDTSAARVYGEIEARLSRQGQRLDDPDLQIAATAICRGLEVVTGNLHHFQRIPGLKIHRALIDARHTS